VRLLRDEDGAFEKKDGRHRAKARGMTGWIDKSDLGTQPLLEIYFIDVGQGDGLLIRTPNDRHMAVHRGLRWRRMHDAQPGLHDAQPGLHDAQPGLLGAQPGGLQPHWMPGG
jgi:hypothetical protein